MTFLEFARDRNLSNEQRAAFTGTTINTIRSWNIGKTTAPAYAVDACLASMNNVQPLSHDDTISVYSVLGVSRQVAYAWRKKGRVPMIARLAAAWRMRAYDKR